ncbi:hypothetical protein RKD23_002865 [Streptomyces sp. SAI-170]
MSRPQGDRRTVLLTRDTLVHYTVNLDRLLVAAVAAFDDEDVLITDA